MRQFERTLPGGGRTRLRKAPPRWIPRRSLPSPAKWCAVPGGATTGFRHFSGPASQAVAALRLRGRIRQALDKRRLVALVRVVAQCVHCASGNSSRRQAQSPTPPTRTGISLVQAKKVLLQGRVLAGGNPGATTKLISEAQQHSHRVKAGRHCAESATRNAIRAGSISPPARTTIHPFRALSFS